MCPIYFPFISESQSIILLLILIKILPVLSWVILVAKETVQVANSSAELLRRIIIIKLLITSNAKSETLFGCIVDLST